MLGAVFLSGILRLIFLSSAADASFLCKNAGYFSPIGNGISTSRSRFVLSFCYRETLRLYVLCRDDATCHHSSFWWVYSSTRGVRRNVSREGQERHLPPWILDPPPVDAHVFYLPSNVWHILQGTCKMCVRVAFLSLNFTSSLDSQGSHFHGESCVAGSVGWDWSIPFCCPASFSSVGPILSCPPWCLALRGALHNGVSGAVPSGVAKSEELASFHHRGKGSSFPATKGTCCRTYVLVFL